MVKKAIGLLTASIVLILTLTGCAGGTEGDNTYSNVPIISAGDNKNDTVGSVVEKGDDPNYITSDVNNNTKPQQSSTTSSEPSQEILKADSIIGDWCTPTIIMQFKQNANEIDANITYFNEGITYEGTVQTDNETYIIVKVENHYINGVLQESGVKEVKYTIKSFEVNSSANTITLTLIDDNEEIKLSPYTE